MQKLGITEQLGPINSLLRVTELLQSTTSIYKKQGFLLL